MDSKLKQKYISKAKDSFKTKMNLFLFDLALNNKDCFELIDFYNFKIIEDLVLKYAAEYWQKFDDDLIGHSFVKEIYKNIEGLKKSKTDLIKLAEINYLNSFSTIFPENKFADLLNDEKGHCHYCKITIQEIINLTENKKLYKKNFRGWSLEIDRKNSNFEYTPDNCVMACYWCNNAKIDEFSYDEFKKFVGPSIQKIWENRLK